MNRRSFFKSAGALGLLSSLPIETFSTTGDPLDILVLGGRDFLGPAVVNAAISSKHKVTLFNRNQTNPEMFTDLPLIIGDRKNGEASYQGLTNKTWDVVIDVWPQESQLVDDATKVLQEHAKHYLFISSIAVYADYSQVGLHEGSSTISLPQDKSQWGYSEEKTKSEQIVMARFPQNHTILRPGPIKGWRDPAVDLAYWLLRFKNNSRVLAPGSGEDPIQFIDVKDVGRFVVSCAENNRFGIYNTTGPKKMILTFRKFLESCKAHTQSQAEIVWVEESFLRDHGVRSFDDMPLWIPLHEDPGFMQISHQKSIQHSFQFSDLSATYRDILSWYENGLGGSHQFGRENDSVGITQQKEQQLLDLWRG
jgi:2'-hydroxyisoflavone reductase